MKIDDNINGVMIRKKADDPEGHVRVSIGGGPSMGGYYCVYRGTKEQAAQAIQAALRAMLYAIQELGDQEPDISPDDGKRYA